MFKISIVETPGRERLVLEGKLVSPWTAEVENAWKSALNHLQGRQLVIDLSNVTVIGPDGEDLLFRLMKDGAKFAGKGVLTRHLLRKLARRCRCRPAVDDNFGKAQTSRP
jgi:hypothetical protein